jgi:hypothetical protein
MTSGFLQLESTLQTFPQWLFAKSEQNKHFSCHNYIEREGF